jgi:hypothetical protein
MCFTSLRLCRSREDKRVKNTDTDLRPKHPLLKIIGRGIIVCIANTTYTLCIFFDGIGLTSTFLSTLVSRMRTSKSTDHCRECQP